MQVPYVKMQGAGNAIVVIDQRDDRLQPPSAAILKRLGSAATGPGFDQLMWLGPPRDGVAAASYRVFNADGSEVEQCGNGVRCVARWLAMGEDRQTDFVLESPAGTIEARVLDDGSVTVNMGPPTAPQQAELAVAGHTLSVTLLSMGNPHCVIEVDDVETADVGTLGPAIEHHERFADGINAGFMCIRDRTAIDLRVHERGVGETLACGTGACAAVVAGRAAGRLDEQVRVNLPGGQLVVSWRGGHEPVWLTGNAELISEGTIDL